MELWVVYLIVVVAVVAIIGAVQLKKLRGRAPELVHLYIWCRS